MPKSKKSSSGSTTVVEVRKSARKRTMSSKVLAMQAPAAQETNKGKSGGKEKPSEGREDPRRVNLTVRPPTKDSPATVETTAGPAASLSEPPTTGAKDVNEAKVSESLESVDTLASLDVAAKEQPIEGHKVKRLVRKTTSEVLLTALFFVIASCIHGFL